MEDKPTGPKIDLVNCEPTDEIDVIHTVCSQRAYCSDGGGCPLIGPCWAHGDARATGKGLDKNPLRVALMVEMAHKYLEDQEDA